MFDNEQRALALLEAHPNVAAIIDGGVAEGGRPYLVMELVSGPWITKYCEDKSLGLTDRLRLFLKVCSAIRHAHERAALHRDIKPANVLVVEVDGDPTPKVVDFGLASLTGQPPLNTAVLGAADGGCGTPEYMAPEQAETNIAVRIDARADVYGLTALLFHMLVGRPPLEVLPHERASREDCFRRVLTGVRQKPSQMVPKTGAQGIRELTNALRYDLDFIIMNGLAMDRAGRYQTVAALAEDVQRYLDGYPVYAHPPSVRYRTKKFVRRHWRRIAVAVGATALLTVVLCFLLLTRWQVADALSAAEAAANREATLRRTAEEAGKNADAVLEVFERRLIAAPRPRNLDGGLGKDVTIRAAFDDLFQNVPPELTEQPLVHARLLRSAGNTYRYLGEYEKSVALHRQAIALYGQHHGPTHPHTLSAQTGLALAFIDLNDPAARPLCEQILAARNAAQPRDEEAVLSAQHNIALALDKFDSREEALRVRLEIVEGSERVRGPDHKETLRAWNAVTTSYIALGRGDEAVAWGVKTLTARRRLLPPDHLDTLRSIHNLAKAYDLSGRHELALPLWQEELEAKRRTLPDGHSETLASVWGQVECLEDLGRTGEAIPLIDAYVDKADLRVLPEFVPDLLGVRLRHFRTARNASECRETATMWSHLGRKDARSAIEAACCWCAAAEIERRKNRLVLSQADVDQAMRLLRLVVQTHRVDLTPPDKYPGLAFLHDNTDFRVLAGLPALREAAPVPRRVETGG